MHNLGSKFQSVRGPLATAARVGGEGGDGGGDGGSRYGGVVIDSPGVRGRSWATAAAPLSADS